MVDIFNQAFGDKQPLNQIPQDTEMIDAFNLHERNLMIKFNCHHIGTIESFDPLTQTATVQIAYQKTFWLQNDLTGEYEATPKPYPLLAQVPVIVLGGGDGALTFPIAAGDDCLVFFNDRDIDNWYQGNAGGTVNSNRLHSMSDAFAMVGIRNLANSIKVYDASKTVLRHGLLAQLALSASAIVAGVGGTTSLGITDAGKFALTNAVGDFMTLLLTVLNDIATATAGGYPLVSPNLAADITNLQSFKP